MDLQKIGGFLASLRREQGMTQEQLGEKLGVTNKTVSRWETGTYLPPVEMLQGLSELYGLSINEILSCRRLSEAEYRKQAEDNIKSALRSSAFTYRERADYFKRKWDKEHFWGNLAGCMLILGIWLYVLLVKPDNASELAVISAVAVPILVLWRRNQKMVYIEARAFDGTGDNIPDSDVKK